MFTKSFNDVCSSQVAMRQTSFYKEILKSSSLHKQLVDVLNDLRNAYLELIGGKKWEGVGHPGQTQHNSVFKGESSPKTLHGGMPWNEWVKKYAKCDHCREMGHIRPTCKKYLAQIESGEIKHPEKGTSRDHLRKGRGGPRKKNYLQDPKARAFLSAFTALFSNDTDDDDEGTNGNEKEDQADKTHEELGNNKDIASFLLMVGGSLKD